MKLSQHTRDEISGFEIKRPDQASTMGIGTIMWVRNCFLRAIGAAKAAAVSTTLGDPASPTMSSERPAVASQANVCSGQESGQSPY